MKKYELTSETKVVGGVKLFRIKLLRDLNGLSAGTLGGWIESEDNLSHEGNCCVSGNARVSDDTRVFGNARVSGNACVSGNARVSDDTRVFGNARVSDNARVYDNAQVFGGARVSGNAWVLGDAWVFGNAQLVSGKIASNKDFMTISNVGDENRTITLNKSDKTVKAGCFHDNFQAFKAAVDYKYGGKGDYYFWLSSIETYLS